MKNNILVFSFVIFFLLLTISCEALLGMTPGAVELFVDAKFFVISWNYKGNESLNSEKTQSYYKVYYREHGTLSWIFLSKYPFTDNPQFIISNSILDYGIYDIAVSFVDKRGFESELHSSLESSAKPMIGWYLHWSPPK